MDASLKFYVDNLGFIMTNKWTPRGKIEWCWLRRDDVSLMLQEWKDKEKFDREGPKGRGVSICFQCADAIVLYREFILRGVDVLEPFVGNNMWVVGLDDPDGYHLNFESATDAPEGMKYSDWFK